MWKMILMVIGMSLRMSLMMSLMMSLKVGFEMRIWTNGLHIKLAVHPKMTTDELASLSGLSAKTIKRHIASMPRLKYIGSGASGYWQVGPKVEKK